MKTSLYILILIGLVNFVSGQNYHYHIPHYDNDLPQYDSDKVMYIDANLKDLDLLVERMNHDSIVLPPKVSSYIDYRLYYFSDSALYKNEMISFSFCIYATVDSSQKNSTFYSFIKNIELNSEYLKVQWIDKELDEYIYSTLKKHENNFNSYIEMTSGISIHDVKQDK